jgi:hypothetical protein
VVPERDHVCSGREHAVGEARRDPDSVREVLAVENACVSIQIGAKPAQTRLDRSPPGGSDDVRDEEDSQESRS